MIPPNDCDCDRDAAAYLLGALEPHEARAFVRHLQGCAACRDELVTLGPAIDALHAAAAPRAARAALRRRVLRAVRAESHGRAPQARPVALGRSAPAGWLALGLAVVAALLVQLGVPHTRTRVTDASVGRAVLRVSSGHGELIVEHLPALPSDRVYELWLEPTGRAPMPSTLFAVSVRGRADIGVPGELPRAGRLLVTVEPRGGSLVPSTRAVVVARLT